MNLDSGFGSRDLCQLYIGAGFGFLYELEQYAAAQVVAALQRGDELAFNPDELRLDEDQHAGAANGFVKEPGITILKGLAGLALLNEIYRLRMHVILTPCV